MRSAPVRAAHRAAQEIEARARDLHAAIEIDNSERLAQLPMRQRLERGKFLGSPSVRTTTLSALARADGHLFARHIAAAQHQVGKLLLDRR